MSLPWLAAVKNTHQLRIFATQAVRDGPWGPVFTRSLQEFNRISQAMKLGVMFVPSARPPDISTMTEGANVQFDVGEGTVQADTYKNWRGEVLHSFKRDFSGRECHGLTMPIATEGSEGIRLRRKYIYVPTAPEFNSAFDGHVNMRVVGNGVKLFIALHELIHACGLDNEDHSKESSPDVFVGHPSPSPGATREGDKLIIRSHPVRKLPDDPPTQPFFFTERTASAIRSLWA